MKGGAEGSVCLGISQVTKPLPWQAVQKLGLLCGGLRTVPVLPSVNSSKHVDI